MNNEDKILAMLETLTTTVTNMQSDIKDLKQGQQETNQRLDKLQVKIDRIEAQQKIDTNSIDFILVTVKDMKNDFKEIDTKTTENSRFISKIKAIN